MCTPHLWTFGIFRIQTIKFMVAKISQYFAFAVFDIVAPWNRPQERRRMPGLQGPQPSSCPRSQSVNASKTFNKHREDRWCPVVSFIATFGERKSLGKFHLDNETVSKRESGFI